MPRRRLPRSLCSPPRAVHHRSRVVACGLFVTGLSLLGCDGSPQAQSAEDLARQLREEQARHRRDQLRHEADLTAAKEDCRGAILGWAGTAAGCFLLIVLVARERRARRVVERLLHLLLGRLREGRGPPH